MKANNIEEYLGTLQQSTVETWKSHLKTSKHDVHVILNDFYEDIVDLVDDLIEEYQGLHGKVKNFVNLMTTDKQDPIKYLEELRELSESGREQFFDNDEEPELQSDVDAILSLIDSTLYKLKELTKNESEGPRDLKKYLLEHLS